MGTADAHELTDKYVTCSCLLQGADSFVTDAIKFTYCDGGSIVVSTVIAPPSYHPNKDFHSHPAQPDGHLSEPHRQEGPQQVFCIVSDNGTGVAPHLRDKLFVGQMNPTETGTGIGLFATQQQAAALGGACGYSPKKVGSIFWVSVPLILTLEPANLVRQCA